AEERDLRELRRQISRLEERLGRLESKERSVALELEKVELELELRDRELSAAERAVASLIVDQNLIERRLSELAREHERQERYLSKRMRALYKMGGLSYLRLLFSARTDQNMLASIGMLNYLVQRDAKAITEFQAMEAAIERESAALEERRVEVERAHEIVRARQRAVEEKRNEQSRLLAEVREQSRRSRARLSELSEKAERLQRLMDLLYSQESRGVSGTPISEFRGALSWPVEGRVEESFGKQRSERFATFTVNNGLTIRSEAGTPVRAIYNGTVLYSQWFKGYGNLIILDHGNRVFSLYGNLRSSGVDSGESVRAGETIGLVGESQEVQRGELYFEIRENNKPVDPEDWLR
ncbi:MAG: peptidoglycan DD-metalloendopeptidase family protein, partial [Thermoanaerobaculia bacterium]|nr:peptidoglycan DD-metalloendopeptidase family protein [Thermoanaerobaculia bacterium]